MHAMEIENDRYAGLIGGQSVFFEEVVCDTPGTLTVFSDRITGTMIGSSPAYSDNVLTPPMNNQFELAGMCSHIR